MHTDEKKDPLVGLGYEEKDINPKLVFRFSMYFFVFALGAWAVGYVAFHFLGFFDTIPNVNNLRSTKIPADPNPVIQTNNTAKYEIKELRRDENEILGTFGPSKYTSGFSHIPIEQAIKLAAERKGKVSVGSPAQIDQVPVRIGGSEPERKPASNAPDVSLSRPDLQAPTSTGGGH